MSEPQEDKNIIECLVPDDRTDLSDLGESIDSDLTSLSSSVRNHVYENGRRYHSMNAGTYAIPNDEGEQERLDMFHHATSLLLDGELHVAKLPEKLDRVLDLGTGTGIWAIDFADQHPESHVIGVDLSPIQPSWVPPNCIFEVDDVCLPWLWTEPFNFIHSANIAQGIHDWPTYAKRMYDNLVPGGVVQLHEAKILFETDDDTIPKGGHIEWWCDNYNKAAELAGVKNVCEDLKGYLEDAGFQDVKVVVKKLPINPWPKHPRKKELGQWGLAILGEGLKSYGLAMFTRYLDMSVQDATTGCDAALAEFRRRDIHSYNAQWFVEGRKPPEE